MKVHHLKCIPPYFEDVYLERKPFEIRRNDRDFQIKDILHIKEYIPETGTFTERSCWRLVTYIMKDFEGLALGYCALAIIPLPRRLFNKLLADTHQNLRNGK